MRRPLLGMRLARPGAGLVAALAAVLAGPVPAAADDACPAEAQGFHRLKTADTEIAYRWEPAELKVGQFFAAEVVACRTAGGPEPVGQIVIDAIMPAHGHGMNYRPKAERVETGHHRFTGLMLHMPGTWRITFDLLQRGTRTRLTHEVDLKR
jgi:hypothetical protein